MLRFVSDSAASNASRIRRLAAVDMDWRSRHVGLRPSSSVPKLARFALTHPVFSIRDAAEKVGVTFANVNAAASILVKSGVLTVPDDVKRDRVFRAPDALAAFGDPKPQLSPR